MTQNNDSGLRLVRIEDAERLSDIYAYYVENSETVVSFETVAPNYEEFRRRVVAISENYPYIVYQQDGVIEGFAYAHPCFERAAYRWSLETTIYLARESKGHGIGHILYGALIELCRELGFYNLYAVIVKENVESCFFHERMGFKEMALFRTTGWKAGRWLDVVWYELQLRPFGRMPEEPVSIADLPISLVNRILEVSERKTELKK